MDGRAAQLKAFIRSGASSQEVTDVRPGAEVVCLMHVARWPTHTKLTWCNGSYGNLELKEETWTKLRCMHVT